MQPYEQKFVDILMLYSVKIFLNDVSFIKIFDFLPFSVLKLHFQHLIFAEIWYNEFLSNDNRIFATLWVEIWQYHDAIFWKNIFRGYFIHKIFDFLPFSVLKLQFQHLIFAKIKYNEFFIHNNWIFATLWVEICRYHDAIFWKKYI